MTEPFDIKDGERDIITGSSGETIAFANYKSESTGARTAGAQSYRFQNDCAFTLTFVT